MLRKSFALSVCAAVAMAVATTGDAAGAEDAERASATIGAFPWAEVASSPAFAAEDAYVFADGAGPARLERDASLLAVRLDLDRLASPAAPAPAKGRVAVAFAGFVAYGAAAYAPADLAAEAASATVARGPLFPASRFAMRERR